MFLYAAYSFIENKFKIVECLLGILFYAEGTLIAFILNYTVFQEKDSKNGSRK